MIETALIAHLEAQVSVSALVGNRIFYAVAKESALRPMLVVVRQNTTHVRTKDGPTGDVKVTFDVVCVGTTADEALRVGYAVSDVLNGFRGAMGDVTDVEVTVTDEKDAFDYQSGIFLRSVEILVWYKK